MADLDRAPVEAAQHDRADLASRAGAPAECNRGAPGRALFKRVPHLVAHQLATAGPQARGVRTRGRPARRRPTHLIRERTTRRAEPPAPPAREMHPGRRRLALAQPMLRASRAGSRPANRAPLLQPPGVIAHDPAPDAPTSGCFIADGATIDAASTGTITCSLLVPSAPPGRFPAAKPSKNLLLCRLIPDGRYWARTSDLLLVRQRGRRLESRPAV